VRVGGLPATRKGYGFEVRSMVVSWPSFVSVAECALPAMRCPVPIPGDSSGARDAHWDTPDFLAGDLAARVLEFIRAVSHIPCRLSANRFHKGGVVSSRPGYRVRLSRLPRALYLDLSQMGTGQCRCRFPTCPRLCCDALPCTATTGFLRFGICPSHNACFCRHMDLGRHSMCERFLRLTYLYPCIRSWLH
jgi:hypothetical protein